MKNDILQVIGGFLLAGLVLFVTMPASAIRGDPLVIRAEAAQLLTQGSLGIPVEYRDHLAPFLQERGQYFYENDESGLLFSKYGILNTILFLPPLAIYRSLTGTLNGLDLIGPLVFILNLYHLLFGLLLAGLLFRLAERYTDSRRVCWVFVFTSLFCTFLWNYLRAQSGEIFQSVFFLLAFDGWLCSRRASVPGKAIRASAVAGLAVAGLILLKAYYLFLVPVGLLWLALPNRDAPVSRRGRILAFSLPTLGGLAILLMINQLKFGSLIESGYGQWAHDQFELRPQLEALAGLLFRPDRSIFLHYPLLLLACAGWWRPARRHVEEWGLGLLVLGISYLGISCFSNWPGHWSYGPRYLLFALPAASLPAVCLFQSLWPLQQHWIRPAGLILVALGLGISLRLQLMVNQLPFFTRYDFHSLFEAADHSDIDNYFERRHSGMINRDIQAWSTGSAPFPPLEMARELQTDEQREALSEVLQQLLWPNYFWLQDASLTHHTGPLPGLTESHMIRFPPPENPGLETNTE